jgi:hypothetical protein
MLVGVAIAPVLEELEMTCEEVAQTLAKPYWLNEK